MCRPSRQVARLDLLKASHQTRDGAAIEGYVGVNRLKARTASDDAFKNKLGRKTFSRFKMSWQTKSPAGDPFSEG